MINYKDILSAARETQYKWVLDAKRHSESNKRLHLSEATLTNHLALYSHNLFNVNAFIAWGNDPRKVTLDALPEKPIEDSGVYRPIPLFSDYYLDFAPNDKPIFRTERLDEFMTNMNTATKELNAVVPAIKHTESDRDMIARRFAELASFVLLFEDDLDYAVKDASKVIDNIYAYKPGRIFVVDPKRFSEIPKDKLHLFGY